MPAKKSKIQGPKPSMELEGRHLRHVSGVKPGGRVKFEVTAKMARKVESTSKDAWDRSSAKLEIQSIRSASAKEKSRFAAPSAPKAKTPRKGTPYFH